MFFRAFAASLLLLTAVPAVAGDYGAAPASQITTEGHRHRHGTRIALAPELKMLWRREEKPKIKALPKEERHGWLRAQWAAMSDGQRRAKAAELEGKWKALPSTVREAMLERIQDRREARRNRHHDRRRGERGSEQRQG